MHYCIITQNAFIMPDIFIFSCTPKFYSVRIMLEFKLQYTFHLCDIMHQSSWIQGTMWDNIPTILNSRYYENSLFFQFLLFLPVYRISKSWYMDGFSLLRYLSFCSMWFMILKLKQVNFDEWWCQTCTIYPSYVKLLTPKTNKCSPFLKTYGHIIKTSTYQGDSTMFHKKVHKGWFLTQNFYCISHVQTPRTHALNK